MQQVTWAPPATGTPNPITIPVGLASIDAVVSAEITRLPISLANHAQAAIVDALAAHAVHSHDLSLSGGGAGGTIIAGAALLSLSAGAQVVAAGGPAGDGVRDNAAVQAHAAGANPVVHAGATPVVAAVPTKITERTFSLDVNTLVGDLLTLVYMERGARLRPA